MKANLVSTPELSPTASAEVSPAFATVLQTPDASDVDGFDFELDAPGVALDDNVAPPRQDLPECWGHRGVGVRICPSVSY